MLPPRDAGYLLDILNAARGARQYLANHSYETFLSDLQCQDAVIRRLEVMGEAARRVSQETRSNFNDIPWQPMIGIRSVMIHDYDDIDLQIVWDTVMEDLPPLIKRLESVVPPKTDK
jgi:uncharacterized protein with HEPN domain